MTGERSTFVSVAEQIVTFNQNSIELLNGLVKVISSNANNVSINTIDSQGNITNSTLPSVGFLMSEINRLSQNLETLSSVDQRGAIIRPANNTYKKIIVADLNREPNPINSLEVITGFNAQKNWFFDSLLNPGLFVRFDLTGKIQDNVRKIQSRRYIIKIDKDEFNVPTAAGVDAANSFNTTLKGRTDITTVELEQWINDTLGIVEQKNGSRINYDEQIFDLDPNTIQYDGLFTILSTVEDITNRKLWYVFDTLNYFELATGITKVLNVGDQVIINTDLATTRLTVTEISNQASQIWVNLTIVEGYEPIPVGVRGGLKFYSPVIVSHTVDVSVGFDEYNVVFVKAINTDNYLISRVFSTGTAYYTNDLTLTASDGAGVTGQPLPDYYVNNVYDYGQFIQDLATTKIPLTLGLKPNAPVLNTVNFKVLQTNQNITDTPDLDNLRKLHATSNDLRSSLDALNITITKKRTELNTKQYPSPADRTNAQNQLTKLVQTSTTTAENLASVVNQITSLQQSNVKVAPTYQMRGYFTIPDPVSDNRTRPQEAIQFLVNYRYLSSDGKTNNTETFNVIDPTGKTTNATYSEWISFKTDIRNRYLDPVTQNWLWAVEDLTNADVPNINALAIDIGPNATIEIRVKTLSEVGWPDAVLESDWSNTMTMPFDVTLLQNNDRDIEIAKAADLNNLRLQVQQDLTQKGLDQHLADQVTVSGVYFAHIADNIGVRDPTGKTISLNDRITQLSTGSNIAANINMVLESPWVNFGSARPIATYYLDSQRVYIGGMIRVEERFFDSEDDEFDSRYPALEAANLPKYTNIAFLPDGYRPQGSILVSVLTYSATSVAGRVGIVEILTNGLIRLIDGNTGYVNLEGINFRISQSTTTTVASDSLQNLKIR
jgi:hypothetical protein